MQIFIKKKKGFKTVDMLKFEKNGKILTVVPEQEDYSDGNIRMEIKKLNDEEIDIYRTGKIIEMQISDSKDNHLLILKDYIIDYICLDTEI